MHLDVKYGFQKVEDKWNSDKFILKYLLYTSHLIKSIVRNLGRI